MKKVIMFSILSLYGISCNKNNLTKNVSNQKKITIIKEKDSLVRKSDSISPNKKLNDFLLGEWLFKENNEEYSYFITVTKDKMNFYVNYCFVRGKEGEEIDCPEEKVIGKFNEHKINVIFISDFEETPIECNLELVGDVLKLEVVSDIGTSLFQKEMDFIKKDKQNPSSSEHK